MIRTQHLQWGNKQMKIYKNAVDNESGKDRKLTFQILEDKLSLHKIPTEQEVKGDTWLQG